MSKRKITRRAVLAGAGAATLPWVVAPGRRLFARTHDVVKLAVPPYINEAPVFMADALGYFDRVGIKVEITTFTDGALVVAPLVSGELDVGVLTASAGYFNSLARGAPFRGFACCGQGRKGRAVTAIVVRTDHHDAGVKTVPDLAKLAGKKAAVGAAGSINQYGLGTGLAMAGLDPVGDVSWQTNVPQPNIVQQLGKQQVDLADITYTLASFAQFKGFAKIIATRDEILPDSQTAFLTVRDDVAEKRRDALVRFTMAFIQAGRLYNRVAGAPGEHPEVMDVIARSVIPKNKKIIAGSAPHWEWLDESGAANVDSMMAQQDFWSDTFSMVKRKMPRSRVYDGSIAPEAVRRLAAERPFGDA